MTRHFAKLLDMIWYLSMGLFLGLNAGTILAVVEVFDSSRKVEASPGIDPFTDARFAEQANEIVAGFMAQNMFKNAGVVALILLGIAILSRIACWIFIKRNPTETVGKVDLSRFRLAAIILCVGLMLVGANHMTNMNGLWPYIYQVEKEQEILDSYRVAFDRSHLISERAVGAAWFAGAFALVISPWCRRLTDVELKAVQ